MIAIRENTLRDAIAEVEEQLRIKGSIVATESWQGIKPPRDFYEINNIVISAPMPTDNSLVNLVGQIQPNCPWANIHFDERISGKPLNPGESYKHWPFYGRDNQIRTQAEKFSHTYMERFWPKHAGQTSEVFPNRGIRYDYGDLNSVVELIKREPHTRQAYLPVFFPEDTGASHKGRIPCTIGYHFIIRNGRLNLNYHIRSCDYLRHFRDDIYLAVRLAEWVRTQVSIPELLLGEFCMFISNLHIFDIEIGKLKNHGPK